MNTREEIAEAYFTRPEVLAHYLRATAGVGLWASEELVFGRVFERGQTLLELGCGTGRIAFGLHELGFSRILGVDLSRGMVSEARTAAKALDYGVSFQVADARALPFEDGLFDGAIFGFNGMMQIPTAAGRRRALEEVWRVIAPGSAFVLTTHDRETRSFQSFWAEETARWEAGEQDPRLEVLGDRLLETPEGTLFMHVPGEGEIESLLAATGWALEFTALRSELANESRLVRDFADECRFWVARKPV